MRRYARSETRRRILRRIREGREQEEEEDEGAAEIGSRGFPFRTPPPAAATMPTVGTRRSTRGFVPKQQQRSAAGDGESVGVMRSGKRFAALPMATKDDDGNEWLRVLHGVDVDGSDLNRRWRDECKIGRKEEREEIAKGIDEKKLFGVVYSRKRRRSTGNDITDKKFGVVFERKHRKKPLVAAFSPLMAVSQNSDIITGSRIQKHQRKRSSLKNTRARNFSVMSPRFGSFRSIQNGSSVILTSKRDFFVGSVSVKLPESYLSDLLSGREESDAALSPGSCSKLRKSTGTKSPIEQVKELRLALADVRQNIDTICCNANILVNDAEKCWREDGAQVRLEMSVAQEWFIAVKRGNVTRFLHKPQDLKSYIFNRYTHAYIWSGDDGWKLEFCDKWDWHVFKELHTECRDRNVQDVPPKAIPVPGVREVSGYEDGAMPSFVRPEMYIHVIDDEIGRALASKISCYDMDSADEEWLRHLKSSLSDSLDVGSCYVSEENFEMIIFASEKDAYSCPDDAYDKDRVLGICQELGTRDTVSAIYDYWLEKRKQKRAPLVRIFQGPPLRRSQLIQKPFLRKKRSFKRQRSQAEWKQSGRGEPLFLQAPQAAIRKVHESEAAANIAADVATQLRTRAQLLMSNADVLAFKAAMALRIAETIQVSSPSSSKSPDLDSSILFDRVPEADSCFV